MSKPSRKELVVHLERTCDRFESDLKAGRAGPVASYVGAAPAALRDRLRSALEELDRAYREDEATTAVAPRARAAPAPAAAPAVIGRYRVEGELGKGGMGEVFRAYDPELGRHLAIKVLQLRHMGRPEALARFRLEERVLALLEHPGVPPIHDVGRLADGRPYYAMKLIRGDTLADLMRGHPAPERLPRLLAIFEQVALTAAYAHSRGVVHRDLKPANIMVGNFGEVQVMDWGLAKVPREEPGAGPPVAPVGGASGTVDGTVMGTPAYMAPEQFSGDSSEVGPHTDVYGLGAILYEVLTGRAPRTRGPDEQPDWAREHAALRAEVTGPPDLAALALRCLAPEPRERPKDAAAVAEALAAYREKITTEGQRLERQRIIARLAATQLARGTVEEAEASYREALRLGPLSPLTVELLVGLGQALRRKRPPDPAGATEAFREALRLDPDCRAAHQGLADALLANGRNGEAVGHLVKAFELADQSSETLPAVREVPAAAAPLAEVAPPLPPEALVRRGRRALAAGDTVEAEALLRQAVAMTPDSPLVLTVLADALLKQGRYEEAARHLSQATRLPEGAAAGAPLTGWVGELDQAMRKAMERWREAYDGNRGE